MALQLADRVQVTATANTTVSFTLGAAVAGYQSFSAITNGNTVYYGATDSTNWEVGIGTWNSGTSVLTRTTILSSSNAGSAVSTFGASVNVWVDYPSSQAVYYDGAGNVGIGIAPTGLDFLELAAGTTAKAPLGFTSGTNLSTTDAGSMEYNGTNLFFTTVALAAASRNVVLTPYVYRKAGSSTLASATGNQSIFTGTLTTGVALAATTTYEFEVVFQLVTTGTTSHTESFGFTYSGTVTDAAFVIQRTAASVPATGTVITAYATAITPTVMSGAITTSQTQLYTAKGTITTNAAGNLLPVVAFSAAPGTTSTVSAGAYMRITPYTQSSATVNIGTWA